MYHIWVQISIMNFVGSAFYETVYAGMTIGVWILTVHARFYFCG